jgi:hypothetical protein
MISKQLLLSGLAILSACGTSQFQQTSSPSNIPDVQSMWQRADGQFDVLCRDQSRELASAAMIQRGLVCNGNLQHAENFTGNAANALDILIVIDNSSSMEVYQQRMAGALTPLLSNISNLDWQIGIVTTDSACLRGGTTIKSGDFVSNPQVAAEKFRTAVTPGGGGAVIERGILYATEGLKGHCGNPANSWLRPNSTVAALLVSDEPNCGGAINEGCPGQPGEKAEYFTANAPAGSKFFGLIFDQNDPNCPYFETPPPVEYWKLVEATGGMWGSICDPSYESFLTRVSSELSGGGANEFSLQYVPLPDQILVMLDQTELMPGQYLLSGNKLRILVPIESSNQVIRVVYKERI